MSVSFTKEDKDPRGGLTPEGRKKYKRETGGGRRTNRLGTLRRLGTKSLRIPLLNISDLNYPL